MPAMDWDVAGLRLEFRAGPAFEYVRTLDGQGPADASFFTVETRLNLMSHLYEHYLREPRSGWEARIETSSRRKGAYSPFSADRVRLVGQSLWNLGRFDPPLAVLGLRGVAETTRLGPGAEGDPTALPPTLRFFLGGDQDIRGFARRQLPPSEQGFLTALYQGVELRAGDVLPYNVQPLVFIDAAMAGRRDLRLDRDVYWSPGAGLRWGSPVGSFRFTFARGYTWRRDPELASIAPHWQFFFSFGQEF
jgi:translocation and assembly module TamA